MKIMIVTAVVFVKLIDFQAFQMKEKIVKEKKSCQHNYAK